MRVIRTVLGGTVAMALVLTGVGVAHAQSSGTKLQATEIGVTPTEIHVALIADVDSPLAPGLFQGVVDGEQAAAKYINSKAGGGGLAGRKLVVDFIDSKLNPTTSRNAVITACSNDLAMVGTAAIFLTSMEDAVSCTDKAGKATGLPDLAGVAGDVEACSPTTFPVNPGNVLCNTVTQNPPTYQANQGAFRYLQRTHKGGLHGATTYNNDTKQGADAGQVLISAALHAGVKSDQSVGLSSVAQQSTYTPIVQKMKQDNSNFAYAVTVTGGLIQWMSEAQLQGLTDPNIVWTCTTGCYDKSIQQNSVTNHLYVPMNFLPFEEASTNKTLANFLRAVGPSKSTGFAVYGWTATLAFADAVKAAVDKGGVNGITRASVLAGIKTLTAFDAGGMTGVTDIADRVSTPCTLLVQLQDSKWKRIWPSKKGTFDCTKSNHITFKQDFSGS
jgi:ABC-type branched-subunit amino acid transport system substrate-binding protein